MPEPIDPKKQEDIARAFLEYDLATQNLPQRIFVQCYPDDECLVLRKQDNRLGIGLDKDSLIMAREIFKWVKLSGIVPAEAEQIEHDLDDKILGLEK
jgi:hypothetical protein